MAMLCPECRTRNPIGNKFCRECGTVLAPPENPLAREESLQVAQERNRERVASLLSAAFALSEKNRVGDALPLAEEAVELLAAEADDPARASAATAAYGLLCTLYERAEKFDLAIAAMEKVVALNPDSAVDKDKLERMRRGVHLLPRRGPQPTPSQEAIRRWAPRLVAALAGAVVLGTGISLLGRDGEPSSERRVLASPAPVPAPDPGTPFAAAPVPQKPYFPPPVGNDDPFRRQSLPQAAPIVPQPRGPLAERDPSAPAGPTLPRLGAAPAGEMPVAPVLPPPTRPAESLGGLQSAPAENGGFGGRLRVGPPAESQSAPPAETEPQGDGYISIKVGAPRGGAEERSETGAQTPLMRGQALQSAGRYQEAIAAYREALAAGASGGSTFQAVALCHQRLGERAAARTAYQQAITAYETQIRSGRGSGAQQGISSCKAALEVLGG